MTYATDAIEPRPAPRGSRPTVRALLALVTSLGCSSCGASSATVAPASAASAATERDWNPREEVDPEQYETKPLFVVAPRAPICPSEEEALGEGCGNSNEWEEGGYWMGPGQSVLVVDEPPQRAVYRTFRYMVSGIFPAWVRADALAARPVLDEAGSRAFAERIEQRGVVELTEEALRAAPMNEPIVLREMPAEALGLLGGSDVHVDLSLSLGGEIVAELRAELERADGTPYVAQHTCATYGDCETLSYGEVPGFDDRITMELVRKESEPGQPLRFDVQALLDRYGYFTKSTRRSPEARFTQQRARRSSSRSPAITRQRRSRSCIACTPDARSGRDATLSQRCRVRCRHDVRAHLALPGARAGGARAAQR